MEHTVYHVTGNVYSLVCSSPPTPETIVLDGYRPLATLRMLVLCEDIRIFLLALASKNTQRKALNYIPKS